MRITVNDRPHQADEHCTVAALMVEQCGDARPHGIAVAVNDEVVRRDTWPQHRLVEGDRIEIVTAVQGG